MQSPNSAPLYTLRSCCAGWRLLLLQLRVAWPVVGAPQQLCWRVEELRRFEGRCLCCAVYEHGVLVLRRHAYEMKALLQLLCFLRTASVQKQQQQQSGYKSTTTRTDSYMHTCHVVPMLI
jgi:hypothetical protein